MALLLPPLPPQVGVLSVSALASAPVQQVAATTVGGASLFEAPRPLFAARTAHSLSVLEAREMEGSDGWVVAAGWLTGVRVA